MVDNKPTTFSILTLVLRPVVSFCVRRSLKYQEFVEALRALYVECGREYLEAQKHEANPSRLSVLTGMHRREIGTYLKGEVTPRERSGTLRKVVGKWNYDSQYLDRDKKPRALVLRGEDSEFFELVHSVNKSVNPYTVLFELERLKLIERDGDLIKLNASEVDLRKDEKRGIELLAEDINTLFKAVDENIFLEKLDKPHHHIATRFDNVALDALPKIRTWFLKEGDKFHAKARKYLARFDKDLNQELWKKKGGAHVALCSVSYTSVSDTEKAVEVDKDESA